MQTEDRVMRAKKKDPKWDADGVYWRLARELAESVGIDADRVYEEFTERSSVRRYLGGYPVDEAESLAWLDTQERYSR